LSIDFYEKKMNTSTDSPSPSKRYRKRTIALLLFLIATTWLLTGWYRIHQSQKLQHKWLPKIHAAGIKTTAEQILPESWEYYLRKFIPTRFLSVPIQKFEAEGISLTPELVQKCPCLTG